MGVSVYALYLILYGKNSSDFFLRTLDNSETPGYNINMANETPNQPVPSRMAVYNAFDIRVAKGTTLDKFPTEVIEAANATETTGDVILFAKVCRQYGATVVMHDVKKELPIGAYEPHYGIYTLTGNETTAKGMDVIEFPNGASMAVVYA